MKNYNLELQTSNNLKECRIKAGLTQFDVMLRMGFRSNDRLSKWEKGTRLPNLVNLFKLAEIYHVTPKELYPEMAQKALCSQRLPEDSTLE